MGHAAHLVEIRRGTEAIAASFDLIVIGASIRYGKYRPDVFAFVEANREALERKPSAFFTVNLVARKDGKDTPETNPYVRAFRRRTTWGPREAAVFAGRLDYQKYSLLDRQIIRFIMWLSHGPTDPSTSADFTDWKAVEEFAQRLARMASTGPGGTHNSASGLQRLAPRDNFY